MSKKNSILTVLLLVQAAFIVFMYRPVQNETGKQTLFFPNMKTEDVRNITITDDTGSSLTLTNDNTNWALQEGGYPANHEKVGSLLKKIEGMESSRLITKTPSSQVRLKVADSIYNRKIELKLSENRSHTFYLGTAPSSKTIHFRLHDQDDVYLVQDIASWELPTDQKSWWQTAYINETDKELQAIQITNSLGTLSLKKKDTDWHIVDKPQNKEENETAITSFIGSLTRLSIESYLGQEKPTDLLEPIAVITYTDTKGPQTLSIWPTSDEDDVHPVKASSSSFYATMRAHVVQKALDASSNQLLIPKKEKVPQDDTTKTDEKK